MTYKRADQLTDAEVRDVLANLLERAQEIEIALAEVGALVLYALDEIETPGAAEYDDTVRRVGVFLKHVQRELKLVNDATQHIIEQEYHNN